MRAAPSRGIAGWALAELRLLHAPELAHMRARPLQENCLTWNSNRICQNRSTFVRDCFKFVNLLVDVGGRRADVGRREAALARCHPTSTTVHRCRPVLRDFGCGQHSLMSTLPRVVHLAVLRQNCSFRGMLVSRFGRSRRARSEEPHKITSMPFPKPGNMCVCVLRSD